MLLIIHTTRHRYVVPREDVATLRAFNRRAGHDQAENEDRTSLVVELGPLLDPVDISEMQRRHALIVPMRRRTIALLVDAVDNLIDHAVVQPLPPLLRERLREPWATGVLMVDEHPIVQLDVRAIARSILLKRNRDTQEK